MTISRDADRSAIKLPVRDTPLEDLMVFASPPQNAGRGRCGDYRFLGLLPAAVKHFSNITRLYIRKYGVPSANIRILIRAWQQVDGSVCHGQMRLTNALVPARVWALPALRPAGTCGKKG